MQHVLVLAIPAPPPRPLLFGGAGLSRRWERPSHTSSSPDSPAFFSPPPPSLPSRSEPGGLSTVSGFASKRAEAPARRKPLGPVASQSPLGDSHPTPCSGPPCGQSPRPTKHTSSGLAPLPAEQRGALGRDLIGGRRGRGAGPRPGAPFLRRSGGVRAALPPSSPPF